MRSAVMVCFLLLSLTTFSQVDTSYVYNTDTSYGPLDIRVAKSADQYYYLQEDRTFSFREIDGVKTNTYLDMTAWDSSPYRQGNMREKTQDRDLFVMNYRLLVPQGYNPSYTPGYPLVLFLHGSLERGNCAGSKCYHATSNYSPNENIPPAPSTDDHELLNNDYNLVHGGSNYLDAHNLAGSQLPDAPTLNARAFPGFVLFPQNLNGWNKEAAENAIKLVRLLLKTYNIDRNKIYINGVSHGGQGAYEVMKRAPWLFAAAALFSAAGDASVIQQNMATKIARIPLWIFQGGQDTNPTPKKTEGYISAIRNAGGNVRYTLYPQLGHGTWNKAFSEPDFFSWLLGRDKADIHVFAGHASVCKTTGEGVKLVLPEAYASYQWEFNGEIVANANEATFMAMDQGSYRARFSSFTTPTASQWNSWSDIINVSENNPSPAQINQVGTLLLNDLNGNANAQLEAIGEFIHYYWYKDGALINFPGTQDDALKRVVITPSLGAGHYALQVAGYDNCKSPLSAARNIVFNNQAPVNILAPSDFRATTISPSEVSLQWTDESANESAFEIWRRRKRNASEFSMWEMVALTAADVTSFADKRLFPASTYQYKIRAVNDEERSDYTPKTAQETLAVITAPDTHPPSAPLDLQAEKAGIRSIRLTWTSSSDDSAIKEYYIYYNDQSLSTGAVDTTFLLKDLDINAAYSFTVKAVDLGENYSPSSNRAEANTYVTGLYYSHSTGAWDDLKSIDWSKPEYTGMVDDFTLSPKTQEDFFNFRFEGYINIMKDGVYQFRISSDDGSRLTLNDTLLIDNDGIHTLTTVTSPVQVLSEGPQSIRVDFFDYVKTDTLIVEYKGPDSNNEWKKIPTTVLNSSFITSSETPLAEAGLNLYPNPVEKNFLTVKLISTLPVNIAFTDGTGRLILERTFQGADISQGVNILSEIKLAPGLYIVSATSPEISVRKRVVVR